MGLIDRYIARHFLLAAFAIMLLLSALFFFVSLVEELDNVGQGTFTTVDAITIVALTLPKRAVDLLPVTALLGMVIGLGTMAGHREIIVLRAIGWSPWRITRSAMYVVIPLVALVLVLQHVIVPPMEKYAAATRSRSLAETAVGASQNEFWTRSGHYLVRVGDVQFGRLPLEIEIYDLTDSGLVQRVTRAANADILDDNRWMLHDILETEFSDAAAVQTLYERMEWPGFLSPKQMEAFIVPAESLSIVDLARYIRKLNDSGLSTLRYRIILWQQLGTPIALVAMSLLGLPFTMGSVRSFTAGLRITIGAGIGIIFYLIEQITGHLALILELSPIPTAIGPDCLILVIALLAIRHLARGRRRPALSPTGG